MERKRPEARCGTVVVCLALIIGGQAWLLRHVLLGGVAGWTAALWVELLFCAVMLGAIVWCWLHPRGWSTNVGCVAAFVVFGLYVVFTLLNYTTFADWYLAGITTQFPSVSKALVALKLILAVMAVIAGIPSAPQMESREYAQKLREAALRQQAEWAKSNAVGAKKDLEQTVAKLRATLSEEELAALMEELKQSMTIEPAAEQEAPAVEAEEPEPEVQEPAAAAEEPEKKSVREEWAGWGCG